MNRKPIPRKPIPQPAMTALVWLALALPLVGEVLFFVGRLLLGMQDEAGARILGHVALGLRVVWAVGLVLLIVALGINSLVDQPDDQS